MHIPAKNAQSERVVEGSNPSRSAIPRSSNGKTGGFGPPNRSSSLRWGAMPHKNELPKTWRLPDDLAPIPECPRCHTAAYITKDKKPYTDAYGRKHHIWRCEAYHAGTATMNGTLPFVPTMP